MTSWETECVKRELELVWQVKVKLRKPITILCCIHWCIRFLILTFRIVSIEGTQLVEVVHFCLKASNSDSYQEAEKILEPVDVAKKRRETGDLALFSFDYFAQVEHVCRITISWSGNGQITLREGVNIQQCYLLWFWEDLPQAIFQFYLRLNQFELKSKRRF